MKESGSNNNCLKNHPVLAIKTIKLLGRTKKRKVTFQGLVKKAKNSNKDPKPENLPNSPLN